MFCMQEALPAVWETVLASASQAVPALLFQRSLDSFEEQAQQAVELWNAVLQCASACVEAADQEALQASVSQVRDALPCSFQAVRPCALLPHCCDNNVCLSVCLPVCA